MMSCLGNRMKSKKTFSIMPSRVDALGHSKRIKCIKHFYIQFGYIELFGNSLEGIDILTIRTINIQICDFILTSSLNVVQGVVHK